MAIVSTSFGGERKIGGYCAYASPLEIRPFVPGVEASEALRRGGVEQAPAPGTSEMDSDRI